MTEPAPAQEPKPQADIAQFAALDIRVGRVIRADPNPKAHKPAYTLLVDFGPDIGPRLSSAQITQAYQPQDLPGRLVLGIVNLPARRVAGVDSAALILGVYADAGAGPVVLIRPDDHPAPRPGDRLG